MILYGRNVISEILKNGKRKIYEIYAAEGAGGIEVIIKEAEKKGIKVIKAERKKITEIAGSEKNQGIAAKTEGVALLSIEEFINKNNNKKEVSAAVLDGVEDPRNTGAVIRSCEVFGVSGLIISSKRAAPINDTVYKTSAGAVEYADIIRVANINNALLKLKKAGFWIYGFDINGDKYLDETKFDKRSVLVFGSEGKGPRRLVRENCDFLLKIRQKGKIDSLNVSNAAAIAFYELSRSK